MAVTPLARVHLGNIQANWRALDTVFPAAETGAVVKANSYGLGASEVTAALAAVGCKTFFVAYGEEGYDVRIAAGNDAAIYAFNGLSAGSEVNWGPDAVRPVLNSAEDAGRWLAEAGADAQFGLMIDTGMNRLGVRIDQIGALLQSLGDRQPALVMSHLACADEPGSPDNERQLDSFLTVAAAFPGVPASLANSAGHGLGPAYGLDLTRPGLALYGGGPAPPGVSLAPGVTVEAPILSVQSVQAGERVGYGGTHVVNEPATLATVSLGYADGVPRSSSNRGFVALDGLACPIVGRVSMDLITVDVSGSQGLAKPGAVVEFLGQTASLDEQANRAGTLGYELLTGMGRRVERIYER
ncbi:MAG: alanine racemase [Pseudomonadota bacterium]